MSKGNPQLSHAGGDISHHLTAKLAEIQKTMTKLPPSAKFLFFSALFFAESLKFPGTLVARCMKGKLAALWAIVKPPYETQGFRLRFLPADLIKVLHALGISSCHRGGCTVQNAGSTGVRSLVGVHPLCMDILMETNYSQHDLFSKFPASSICELSAKVC